MSKWRRMTAPNQAASLSAGLKVPSDCPLTRTMSPQRWGLGGWPGSGVLLGQDPLEADWHSPLEGEHQVELNSCSNPEVHGPGNSVPHLPFMHDCSCFTGGERWMSNWTAPGGDGGWERPGAGLIARSYSKSYMRSYSYVQLTHSTLKWLPPGEVQHHPEKLQCWKSPPFSSQLSF